MKRVAKRVAQNEHLNEKIIPIGSAGGPTSQSHAPPSHTLPE